MRIYVGNIAWAMTDKDLECLFSQYGKVNSAKVIVMKATGKSRGYGFVEMNVVDGWNAVKNLNGSEIFGRVIIVTEGKKSKNNSHGMFSNF